MRTVTHRQHALWCIRSMPCICSMGPTGVYLKNVMQDDGLSTSWGPPQLTSCPALQLLPFGHSQAAFTLCPVLLRKLLHSRPPKVIIMPNLHPAQPSLASERYQMALCSRSGTSIFEYSCLDGSGRGVAICSQNCYSAASSSARAPATCDLYLRMFESCPHRFLGLQCNDSRYRAHGQVPESRVRGRDLIGRTALEARPLLPDALCRMVG